MVKKNSVVLSMILLMGAAYYFYAHEYPQWMSPPRTSQLAQSPDLASLAIQDALQVSSLPPLYQSSIVQLVHAEFPIKSASEDENSDESLMTMAALVDKVIVIPSVRMAQEHQREHLMLSQLAIIPKMTKRVVPYQKIVKKKTVAVTLQKRFTIQLLASHKGIEISRLKKENPLYKDARVRHFTNQNGYWYVVTLGEFNSYAKAQEHLNQLPETLSDVKPWVRPMSRFDRVG